MKDISQQELTWMQLAAFGPFSCKFENYRVTSVSETKLCRASTYTAMIGYGWLPEVL